jgi:hypothetical protein
MVKLDDREYHTQRAQAELDWSYRADNKRAAEAHMRLSAMHMERLHGLSRCGPELPADQA